MRDRRWAVPGKREVGRINTSPVINGGGGRDNPRGAQLTLLEAEPWMIRGRHPRIRVHGHLQRWGRGRQHRPQIHGLRYTCAGECNTDGPGTGRPEGSLRAERVSTETQGATRGVTKGHH